MLEILKQLINDSSLGKGNVLQWFVQWIGFGKVMSKHLLLSQKLVGSLWATTFHPSLLCKLVSVKIKWKSEG